MKFQNEEYLRIEFALKLCNLSLFLSKLHEGFDLTTYYEDDLAMVSSLFI